MSTISAMINVTSSVVINDFIKRYFARDISQRRLVRLGQIASVAAVIVGFVFSLSFSNIVTAWEAMVFVVVTVILVPATLRWHYWRFGAKAFVWGMGASAVLISLRLIFVKGLHASASLAIDVGIGLVTTVIASALTKPADMEVLVKFYAKVRPFGFWGPVRRECVRRGLVSARDKMPKIDMLNGLVTAAFQFSLAILPFYLFLRNWRQLGIWAAAAAGIAIILYFTWYKNLPSKEEI
jgi:Na+/proline symporter